MNEASQFLVRYGLPVLFTAVLVEQLGLPLPSEPLLLAVGALSTPGNINGWWAFALTVLACLIADTVWFYLGRYRGHKVLRLLCRISLEPDSCVRRTQNVFTRYGVRGLIIAKFVPGLSTVAPPLAGMSGVSIGSFLAADGLGSLLYAGSFIFLGYLFRNQIQQVTAALSSVGGSALSVVLGLLAIYLGFKYWQRYRILRELRMARITVSELRQKQDAGEELIVIDLRPGSELDLDPSLIPGAIHLAVDEVDKRHGEIPRDREVIDYCSCPNEVSSARVALLLRGKGITRIRPLLGGIDAWRDLNYPVQPAPRQKSARSQAQVP